MSTKKELMEDPNSCWNKAKDDEPLFVLRGQDIMAAGVVREWAVRLARWLNTSDSEKIKRALNCANAMEAWPNRKYPD